MSISTRQKIMPFAKIVIYLLVLGGLFFLMSELASAQNTLGNDWDKYLNDLPSFQAEEDQAGEDLAINFIRNAISIVRNILGAAALLTGTIYGTLMVLARGKEEPLTKQKKNFIWALMGFVILIAAEGVANLFNPESASTQALIDFNAARDQLRDIINYVTWIAGSVMILFMTINGIRMITAGSDQERIDAQKKNLTWSLLGILVILLARNIINAIYVLNSPSQISPGSSENLITQVAGVVRLILVFLGPIAIAFTLYAGFLYLTSLDKDEPKQKATKMLTTGIIAIVMIYSAFALVSTITTQDFTTSEQIEENA